MTTRAKWDVLRVEYAHGTMTLRELAAVHGVPPAGVMKRAAREGWVELRQQVSAAVSGEIERKMRQQLSEELSRWNAADLALFRGIRARVGRALSSGDLTPAQLRQLSGAARSAQDGGRLALGASTANVSQTATEPAPTQELTTEEADAAIDRLLGSI